MDALYFFLLVMTVVGLVLVGALVFGFSMRYRKAVHPVATQIEGSTLLEATWTIIPLAIFLVVFVWGALLYFRIYTPPRQLDEHLRRRQAVDVEGGASGRPARDQCAARAHRQADPADDDLAGRVPQLLDSRFPHQARSDSGPLLDGVV